ncbi:MAG: hypothetical protein U0572_05510 [Phycisphaerales bacterium]
MNTDNEGYEIEPGATPASAAPQASDAPENADAAPIVAPTAQPEGDAESPPKATPKPKAIIEPAPAPRRPLLRSTRFEWALVLAGCAAAIFVAASLAGQSGLFPPTTTEAGAAEAVVSWADRSLMLLRGLLRIALGSGCLVAGAYFLHFLDRRQVGDIRALAARMVAITSLSLLVMLVPIDILVLKRFYDALVPLAAAWILMMIFFRISPRDSGVILLGSLVAITVLAFGSMIVGFAVR